jgi:hypothetical protein
MMKKNGAITTKARRRRTNQKQALQGKSKIEATLAELNRLQPKSAKAAKVIGLFKSWLADESGYDEETWPRLRKALEEERQKVGARRLFDG